MARGKIDVSRLVELTKRRRLLSYNVSLMYPFTRVIYMRRWEDCPSDRVGKRRGHWLILNEGMALLRRCDRGETAQG